MIFCDMYIKVVVMIPILKSMIIQLVDLGPLVGGSKIYKMPSNKISLS